jgi:hypothetical protein
VSGPGARSGRTGEQPLQAQGHLQLGAALGERVAQVLLGPVQPVAHGVLVQLEVLSGGDVAAQPEGSLQRLPQPGGLGGVLGQPAELGAHEAAAPGRAAA